jgi:hypothetical protein
MMDGGCFASRNRNYMLQIVLLRIVGKSVLMEITEVALLSDLLALL